MRFRWRGVESEPDEGRPQAEPAAAADWRRRALEGVSMLWLRIDRTLRVVEAASRAVEFFERPTVHSTLINFTRTPEVEERARDVLDGRTGPWDVEAANFRATLRLRG